MTETQRARGARVAAAHRSFYRDTLLNQVVPFWLRHGVDRRYGGIGNILDDAGNTTGHDKYLWSQGRALWTFSALYNRVEPRAEWFEFAHHIYRYLRKVGPDSEGRWAYRLDKNGQVIEGPVSILVDGFVLNGLGEYYKATGDEAALRLACSTFESVLDRLQRPGSFGIAPYEVPPGLKTHSVAMIFAFFGYNLGKTAGRADYCAEGLRIAREILSDFYRRDKEAIVEYVSLDGSFSDTPQGRACVPGHGLESMWFLISIFERSGDEKYIPLCCDLIRRNLELAWDTEYGGLRLALDIDGREPAYWQRADCKPWWVQVEALVATGYAHLYTGEAWCLDWHRKVQEWAWARYPTPSGEWTQWLDARGEAATTAALPVKDPFHLPRALIYLSELFERVDASSLHDTARNDRSDSQVATASPAII
jgi:N-acylglucosamine 2-epimerase